jgi:hypothetical protein
MVSGDATCGFLPPIMFAAGERRHFQSFRDKLSLHRQ